MTKTSISLGLILLILLLTSCKNENTVEHDFTLKGHIEGLKKGTVFLQRQNDSAMVTLDSLEINGKQNFELHSELAEPELLFLKLDKNDNDEGSIAFFADKGITEINTSLKNFNFDATITGSKQQEVLDEYLIMMAKFNDKNLDIIQESLEAQKNKDTTAISFEDNFNSLLKRKYLYTINFAVNHPDSEVSPYLAISEIQNTSVSFLKQIYEALDDHIKASKYGLQLQDLIEERNN